jgi:hypothetical protein
LAAALVVSAVLTACGGSDSGSSSDSTGGPGTTTGAAEQHHLGEPLRVHAPGTTLVVTAQRVIFPLRNSGVLLAPGDAAAGVEISLRNAGHGVYDSSSESDVKLRTSTGQFADAGFAPRGECITSEIDILKEVTPGESRSGCVVYDVPKGSQPTAVTFAPQGRTALGRTWLVQK